MEGTTIFACELFGRELQGKRLERTYDAVTGLKLWEGA
jgi:predicted DNA-binding protein with PD1-like motif